MDILTDTAEALGHVFNEAEPRGSLSSVIIIIVISIGRLLGTLGDLLLAPVALLVALSLSLSLALAVAAALGTVALSLAASLLGTVALDLLVALGWLVVP